MSSKINAISTGDGGLATSADASGILELQTNDTTAITIDGSQNVAIAGTSAGDVLIGGTTQPTGLGAIERFRIVGAGSGITGGPVSFAQFRYANDATGVFQRVYKSRNDSVNGHTAVQDNDLIYQYLALGSDGTTSWQSVASYNILVDGAVSTGVVPGKIVFRTGTTTGGQADRFGAFANGNFAFDSGYGSMATAYGCRAWVNFNGTGTVAIRSSGNVSSITDNGTGDYTVNFTTALPDANYATTGMTGGVNTGYVLGVYSSVASPSTTSVRVGSFRAGVGLADEAYINVTIFR